MPQIILGPQQHAPTIDGSVRSKAYAFLAKLAQHDSLPGLHVEPMVGARDPRVRTGRVDQFWRAVLFKVQGHGVDAMYVYLGVWPHDDAAKFAVRAELTVNPVNGIAELLVAEQGPRADDVEKVLAANPAAEQPAEPLLASAGLSVDDLVGRLGLSPELAELAFEATTADALLVVAELGKPWEGVALIDLSAGKTVDQVRETLGVDDEPVEQPADEPAGSDDQLARALHRPASQLQFAFVDDDVELRRAVEDGDFQAWRVFLHPEQRKYVTRSWNGPFRLSGGAGTGKTVVLLHRARRLAKEDPTARILLTTFNRTLAEALQRDLAVLDPSLLIASGIGLPGVHVRGVDSVARSVLSREKDVAPAVADVLGSRTPEVSRITDRNAWRDAVASAGADLPPHLRSPVFLEAEYATVVLPNRVLTFADYAKVRRPGRGTALDRGARAAVWKVVEAYRREAGVSGSIDFGEAAAVAAAALDRRGERPYDHVLVDEGQDLAPAQWQLLRALVGEARDDLFIAEDSHQRIYGQRLVLGRYGIRIVGRSQRLRLNYRTTAQNLRYAVSVLSGTEFVDLEDHAEDATEYRSARTGPSPRLVRAKDPADEVEQAAALVRGWVEAEVVPETIGLLVRTQSAAERLARGLEERGVPARAVTERTVPAGRPVVMTMHRAKGMEFSRVLISGADSSSLPASHTLDGLVEADREDALRRERSLLYVAATRARDELVLLWSGEPSGLLPSVQEGP